MRLNKKGMTLMEILVVLLISSIVMVIAGSLILNGIGYFDKTASSDVDKQVSDSMASLARDELVYASEVCIQEEKPEGDDWHWLSLNEDSYLMKDDALLYQKDFYNHKKLKVEAYVYTNKQRLDLKFTLMEGTKSAYTTSTTIELVNAKNEILTSNKNVKSSNANYELVDISYASKNKIYYRKGNLTITDNDDPVVPPSGDQDGTVGDEILCKTDGNDEGEWEHGEGYDRGSFVQYKGVWYRAVHDRNSKDAPDKNNQGKWKVIDRVFHINSSYERGDVVEWPANSDKYYIAPYDLFIGNNDDYTPGTMQGNGYWAEIPKDQIDKDKYNSCKPTVGGDVTVAGEYDRCSKGEKIQEWKDVKSLKPGEYVKYDGELYRYIGWYNMQEYNKAQMTPNMNVSSRDFWKKIQERYDKYSGYFKYDIVYDEGAYYQVREDVIHDGRLNWGGPPHTYPDAWKKLDSLEDATAPACRTQWVH